MGLEDLPKELLIHVLSYLEPVDIARLQRTSRLLRAVGRDREVWRSPAFDQSTFLSTVGLLRAARGIIGDSNEHRLRNNWDPSFPGERVSWYNEYIHRHAPVVVNWFQQPRMLSCCSESITEARGMALYRPGDAEGRQGAHTLLSVSPLDDGSVCLWDVSGTRGKRGAIVAKSKPGILFVDGPSADNSSRSKRIDSGVTECVSVDSHSHRAYFAVQSHLIEVDLQRLSVVGCESFPFSITALSEAHPTIPLTVGTNFDIHLHDARAGRSRAGSGQDSPECRLDLGAKDFYDRSLGLIFSDEPPPSFASLAQPGPLSILHLERPGGSVDLSDDIFVAGRFSNILHYDRRSFPVIKGSLHSGARLCSMTSLPFPFSAVDSDLRRAGLLSSAEVKASKTVPGGRTLVACGEYNTKGSLEIYGLRAPDLATTEAGGLQNSAMKNRQSASESKLLSVVNHGARLAFSDGSGTIRWFERDGVTEIRRCRIGHGETGQPHSLFASMAGSDEIARKLLATSTGGEATRANDDNLVFWTGERIGMIGFSSERGSTADDFDHRAKTAEEATRERQEQTYSDMMRQALELQAGDARFVQRLGLGRGPAS